MLRQILTSRCDRHCPFQDIVAESFVCLFCTGSYTHNKDQACVPVDRWKKSSDVPAIPDVPQAAEDILKSIAPEIEKIISNKLAGTTPGGINKLSDFREERNNTW